MKPLGQMVSVFPSDLVRQRSNFEHLFKIAVISETVKNSETEQIFDPVHYFKQNYKF